METVVTVKNLRKTFSSKIKEPGLLGSLKSIIRPNYKQVTAVDDISFDVKKGEILAFIGPNGAGKSTTIKMLIGILYPTSGEANVLGYEPWSERQKLSFKIGSIFGQKPQLWYHLPAIDTFNLLSKIYELDPKEYSNRLDYLVSTFGIEDLIKTPVRKLSLGQRMRCEIVASLLHKPKIVFMDEPTIGLDVITKQRIRDLIQHLNRKEKTTIFLTSHDAGDVEKLCKRVIVINYGKVIFNDTLAKLREEVLLNKVMNIKLGSPAKIKLKDSMKVLQKSKYQLKIEVDTKKEPIQDVLNFLSRRLDIADVTVSDPPIEEIIAKIYGKKK